MDNTQHKEHLLKGYTGRIFLLLTVGLIGLKIGNRLLPPLVPIIVEELEVSLFAAGLALSVLEFMRAVFQYPGGRFSDQLSRSNLLIPALIIGLVGYLILATAISYWNFLVGAAFLGIGLGLYDPAARGFISDLFIEKRGRAFGFHIGAEDLAGILASGLAILAAGIIWQISFVPSIIIIVPSVILLYIISPDFGDYDWVILDVEKTFTRLLKKKTIRRGLLAYSITVFASAGATGFLVAFLVTVHGISFKFATALFGGMYVIGMIIKPLSGFLSDYIHRLTIVGGSLIMSGISLGVLIVAPNTTIVIISVLVYAAFQRAFPPPFQAYFMDQFPDSSMAGDLGSIRTIYMMIGSIGPAYVGFVIGQTNYVITYATLVLCFLVAGFIAITIFSNS